MFPKKQAKTFGGRLISRMKVKGQNGWCCNKKKCTAHKEGFHPSFIEAVFCGWDTAPVQDIARMLTSVGKVTIEDYERAEPEQLLSLLHGAVAANILYLGKKGVKMNRDFAEREESALVYIQSFLPVSSVRIWYFLQEAAAMYRFILTNNRN